MNNSVIIDGHHTLMSAVMQGVRSVQSGLNNAVQGLLTGFEVSQVMLFSHKAVVTFSLGRPCTCPRDSARTSEKPAEDQIW